jgi:hypothetical protein
MRERGVHLWAFEMIAVKERGVKEPEAVNETLHVGNAGVVGRLPERAVRFFGIVEGHASLAAVQGVLRQRPRVQLRRNAIPRHHALAHDMQLLERVVVNAAAIGQRLVGAWRVIEELSRRHVYFDADPEKELSP